MSNFFTNFLLCVELERNRMIIFIFLVSRSIPIYYGMKWSNNGIFKFFEFFFSIFFGIFYYVSCRNGTERKNNFYFLSFWAGLNLFFLQMKPKWYSSNFLNFFAICLEFSIRHWVGTKGNDNLYFLSFSAFSNQFMIEKKPYQFFFLISSIFLQFFMNLLLRVG